MAGPLLPFFLLVVSLVGIVSAAGCAEADDILNGFDSVELRATVGVYRFSETSQIQFAISGPETIASPDGEQRAAWRLNMTLVDAGGNGQFTFWLDGNFRIVRRAMLCNSIPGAPPCAYADLWYDWQGLPSVLGIGLPYLAANGTMDYLPGLRVPVGLGASKGLAFYEVHIDDVAGLWSGWLGHLPVNGKYWYEPGMAIPSKIQTIDWEGNSVTAQTSVTSVGGPLQRPPSWPGFGSPDPTAILARPFNAADDDFLQVNYTPADAWAQLEDDGIAGNSIKGGCILYLGFGRRFTTTYDNLVGATNETSSMVSVAVFGPSGSSKWEMSHEESIISSQFSPVTNGRRPNVLSCSEPRATIPPRAVFDAALQLPIMKSASESWLSFYYDTSARTFTGAPGQTGVYRVMFTPAWAGSSFIPYFAEFDASNGFLTSLHAHRDDLAALDRVGTGA